MPRDLAAGKVGSGPKTVPAPAACSNFESEGFHQSQGIAVPDDTLIRRCGFTGYAERTRGSCPLVQEFMGRAGGFLVCRPGPV